MIQLSKRKKKKDLTPKMKFTLSVSTTVWKQEMLHVVFGPLFYELHNVYVMEEFYILL